MERMSSRMADPSAGLSLVGGHDPSGATTPGYVPFEGLPDVCTTEQAAAALQIDPKTVRAMIRRGELRGIRCGRLIRVPKASLVEFCGGD